MIDAPLGNEARNVLEWRFPGSDLLSGIGRWAMRSARASPQERVTGVGQESGIRANRAEPDEFVGRIARLFEQLSSRGVPGRFPGINGAPGNFPRHPARPMAELFDQHDVLILGERDDVHPIGGIENIALHRGMPVALARSSLNSEYGRFRDLSTGDDLPLSVHGFNYTRCLSFVNRGSTFFVSCEHGATIQPEFLLLAVEAVDKMASADD